MSSEQRATSSSAAIPAPTALGPPRVRPSPAATRSTPAAPLPSRSGTGNALGPGTGRSRCPRILHIPRTAVEAPPPSRPSPPPLRAGRAQRRCEPRYRGERSPSGARGGPGLDAVGSALREALPQPRYPPVRPAPSSPPPRPGYHRGIFSLGDAARQVRGAPQEGSGGTDTQSSAPGGEGGTEPLFPPAPRPAAPQNGRGGGVCVCIGGGGGSGGGPVGRTRIPERFPVKSRGHRRRCPGERSGADPGVGEGRSARGRAQREAAGMGATNRERGSSGRGGTGRCWGGRYLEPLRGAAGPGPAP